METIKVKKIDGIGSLPNRAHPNDAGMDLFSVGPVTIEPGQLAKIPTDIAMAIPDGHVGMICDKSSVGAKGVKVMGGIIDAGYRGDVTIVLANLSTSEVTFSAGQKVAQMLIVPVKTPAVEEVSSLDETTRGTGGFGSTGTGGSSNASGAW